MKNHLFACHNLHHSCPLTTKSACVRNGSRKMTTLTLACSKLWLMFGSVKATALVVAWHERHRVAVGIDTFTLPRLGVWCLAVETGPNRHGESNKLLDEADVFNISSRKQVIAEIWSIALAWCLHHTARARATYTFHSVTPKCPPQIRTVFCSLCGWHVKVMHRMHGAQ